MITHSIVLPTGDEMADLSDPPATQTETFLRELIASLANPIHKRLINSYHPNRPVASMETELAAILKEIMADENQESDDTRISRLQRRAQD